MPHILVGGLGLGKSANVPIITYHSIANDSCGWLYRHLSCPVSIFESHLKALRWSNYHSISLQNLYQYMSTGNGIPPRSVVLTFDDGYLDNWVYAYPLLKKYGCQGTVFVNPDFVDPAESLRPNLEDVWYERRSMSDLPTTGFLSWMEMREMEKSGCIDIQSHGLTHTWYFSTDVIIDFHHPGDSYPWLAWNTCPERKYLWMKEDQHTCVPWGTPVYEHGKSLATRRYFPDQDLDAVLVNFVESQGGETFFQRADWGEQLKKVAVAHRQRYGERGYYESDSEYRARLYSELAESKRVIAEKLNKTVDFLCWPGGGYTDVSAEIAKEVGYFAAVHSSWDRSIPKNRFGTGSFHWSRISPPTFRWRETNVEYKGGLHLICLVNSVRGNICYTVVYKALRIPFKLLQYGELIIRNIKDLTKHLWPG